MIIIVLIFKAELDGQVKRPIKAGVDLIVLRFGMGGEEDFEEAHWALRPERSRVKWRDSIDTFTALLALRRMTRISATLLLFFSYPCAQITFPRPPNDGVCL